MKHIDCRYEQKSERKAEEKSEKKSEEISEEITEEIFEEKSEEQPEHKTAPGCLSAIRRNGRAREGSSYPRCRQIPTALPASFTVEASLLMTVILPVLIALIITGFYVHDQACLQGTACEAAALGSCLRMYDDRAGVLQATMQKRRGGILLWTKGAGGSAQAGRDASSASCSGQFPLPSLTAALLAGSSLQVGASWQKALYQPARLIWKIKGVRYLLHSTATS